MTSMQYLLDLLEASSIKSFDGAKGKLLSMAKKGLERQEAIDQWLEEGYSKESFYVTYKSLKDRLLKNVYKSKGKLTTFQIKRMEVWEKHKAVQQLMIAGKRPAATSLAIEVVQLAIKCDFTEIVLSLSSALILNFGALSNDARRYYHYKEINQKYLSRWNNELKARSIYAELIFFINKKKKLGKFKEDIDWLEKQVDGSSAFMLHRFNALAAWYRRCNEISSLRTIFDQTDRYFSNNNYLYPQSARIHLYYSILPILIAQEEYPLAGALIARSLDLTAPGSHNWQAIMLFKATLGFYSEKPGIALNAYKQAIKRPKEMSEEVAHRWQLVGAYLSVLGLLENFDFKKLGDDVPARFARALHCLSKNRALFHKEIIAMRRFWTASKLGARERAFFELLKTVSQTEFDRRRTIMLARSWYTKLRKKRLAMISDDEMVPFEQLWALVLGMINANAKDAKGAKETQNK